MKAAIRETGEIIEVNKLGDLERYCSDEKQTCYRLSEIDLINDEDKNILINKNLYCKRINIKDINIYDIFYHNNDVVEVNSISVDGKVLCVSLITSEFVETIVDELKEIRVNEEMFIKLGFQLVFDNYECKIYKNNNCPFFIYYDDINFRCFPNEAEQQIKDRTVKYTLDDINHLVCYLHQFQHICFRYLYDFDFSTLTYSHE